MTRQLIDYAAWVVVIPIAGWAAVVAVSEPFGAMPQAARAVAFQAEPSSTVSSASPLPSLSQGGSR